MNVTDDMVKLFDTVYSAVFQALESTIRCDDTGCECDHGMENANSVAIRAGLDSVLHSDLVPPTAL